MNKNTSFVLLIFMLTALALTGCGGNLQTQVYDLNKALVDTIGAAERVALDPNTSDETVFRIADAVRVADPYVQTLMLAQQAFIDNPSPENEAKLIVQRDGATAAVRALNEAMKGEQ